VITDARSGEAVLSQKCYAFASNLYMMTNGQKLKVKALPSGNFLLDRPDFLVESPRSNKESVCSLEDNCHYKLGMKANVFFPPNPRAFLNSFPISLYKIIRHQNQPENPIVDEDALLSHLMLLQQCVNMQNVTAEESLATYAKKNLAQLLHVSIAVVYFDCHQSDRQLQEQASSLQGLFKLLAYNQRKTGGFLVQYGIDLRGFYAVLGWGLPYFCYSNDSTRALYFGVSVILNSMEMNMPKVITFSVNL
jgi:hypothetical protein